MARNELEDVLRDNYSLVRAVCWRILQDDADADDATQNALISIARGFEKFDQRSAISTWIYRIATNAALDELRRRRRRRSRSLVDAADRMVEVPDPRSHEAVTSVVSKDAMETALSRVPEEFRLPLVLRDVADMEYDEIARLLDIPPGTVRSRISRGRARLALEWSNIEGNPQTTRERPTAGTADDSRDPS